MKGLRGINACSVPVPSDPALAGLAALLDPTWFRNAVAAYLLPSETVIEDCRPRYVRYKPATNGIVVYELTVAGEARPLLLHGKCYTREDFAAAREKAVATNWFESTIGRPFAAVAKEQVLLFAFPNDQALPGLELAAHPRRMRRLLSTHCDDVPEPQWRVSDRRIRITPVRFKPEKRAVLRVDTRAVERTTDERRDVRVYARAHADDRGAITARMMAHLREALAGDLRVRVPRPLAWVPEHRTLLVADAGGEVPTLDATLAVRAGEALAACHGVPDAPVAVRAQAEVMADAADTVRTIAQLAPELTVAAGGLLARLAQRAADLVASDERLVHGDFHPGQFLVRDGQTILLDFDRSYLGDPAADLGNFAANVTYRALADATLDATGITAAFTRAYTAAGGGVVERDRLAYWTSFGLLQLAPTPFRSLDKDWPQRTAAIVNAAQKVLP